MASGRIVDDQDQFEVISDGSADGTDEYLRLKSMPGAARCSRLRVSPARSTDTSPGP
jgi:hypothetical protein